MTAFEAPIFPSLELARKWVYHQYLDEQLILCRIDLDGGTRYEFHTDESLRFIYAYYPNLVNHSVVETWM